MLEKNSLKYNLADFSTFLHLRTRKSAMIIRTTFSNCTNTVDELKIEQI